MDLLDCCTTGDEVGDESSDYFLSTLDVDPLAVDYLTSTPLFDAIVRNDWHAVNFFLDSGTFSFSPFQPSDQESTRADAVEDQVETWVVCLNDDGRVIWRQLPIHAAICYGAPYKTVEELVTMYPAGLCCADTEGNLPLHLAVKFNHPEDVLRLLLSTFPEAFHAENGKGQTPLQCAENIEDPEGKERFERFQAFQEAELYLAKKLCGEKQEELEELDKRVKEASTELNKAQRELWYLKTFPIPVQVISRKKRLLLPWKKSSKRRVQNE
jgi:Ankyrin repeats (many copies)